MARKAPQWLVPAVIWLLSILVLSHTGHLWVLLTLPSATQGAPYGVFLHIGMSYGWVLGVFPAGYAWRLLERNPARWRSLTLCAMAYWAALTLVVTFIEVICLGSPMTLRMLPDFIVALPASLRAVSIDLLNPVMLAISVLGLLPMMGLLWWFGASGRRKRS